MYGEFNEYEEIDWDNGTIKPVVYFAHYISVGHSSPMRRREDMFKYVEHIENSMGDTSLSPHRVVNFFIPVKDGDSRIELLYPGPAITKEKLEEYNEKMTDFLGEIEYPF